jgi:glycosyltransferase involved in cell wall biosynthesis
MRVLWFINVPFPEVADTLGLEPFHKAGWLSSYANALLKLSDVEIVTVTRSQVRENVKVKAMGIVHHVLSVDSMSHLTKPMSKKFELEYLNIIRDTAPDLVHFHGTEYHYGLLAAGDQLIVPSVVSIQGLISDCTRFLWGGLRTIEIIQTQSLRDITNQRGLMWDRINWERRAKMEHKIIRGNKYFIGRTRWDRAHLKAINKDLSYFHCDELMRPPFYEVVRDSKNIERFSIFSPTASYPLKGFHWLLRAAKILKAEFPTLQIRLADKPIRKGKHSTGYDRYLWKLIDESGLTKHVTLLGALNAEGMANELARAHVFVSASMVENRCNSLAEAMLIGTPAVVSLAGGMVSTVKDRQTALCFPLGDFAMLAECIRMIFANDALANRLAASARVLALRRHDAKLIAERLRAIYKMVCLGEKERQSIEDD